MGELHAHGTTPTGLGITFSPDSRVLAVGQPNGVLRLVDPFTGNDWADLTHWDQNVHAIMAFSRDQRYLVTSPIDGRSPAHVWDLRAMRSELVRRGLDWPANVLAEGTRPPLEGQLEVVLDDGGLIHQRDAAGSRKTVGRLWQDSVNLLQRAMQAATAEQAAE
ncbi:MAG: hypothetical protein AB7O59_19895 [Pirellulales bacterium]